MKGGGGGAKSSDGKKSLSSINHSILSGKEYVVFASLPVFSQNKSLLSILYFVPFNFSLKHNTVYDEIANIDFKHSVFPRKVACEESSRGFRIIFCDNSCLTHSKDAHTIFWEELSKKYTFSGYF